MAMRYPEVRVGGSIDSGLIITAALPMHLNPRQDKDQALILTPAQSIDLLQQIKAMESKAVTHLAEDIEEIAHVNGFMRCAGRLFALCRVYEHQFDSQNMKWVPHDWRMRVERVVPIEPSA